MLDKLLNENLVSSDCKRQFFFYIIGDSCLKIHNVDQGINVIKQRLCHKKILLVLDDVDHSSQLEKLCERCDWFGLGSRIIVTTRDHHLLT